MRQELTLLLARVYILVCQLKEHEPAAMGLSGPVECGIVKATRRLRELTARLVRELIAR